MKTSDKFHTSNFLRNVNKLVSSAIKLKLLTVIIYETKNKTKYWEEVAFDPRLQGSPRA